MKRKAAFHSLGCKVNSYETDAMRQSLLAHGYEEVPFAPGADVYVINTCTVTNIADRKSRQMLHRAKEMNPSAIVVAAGCYVHDAGDRLKKDPAVDVIVGNHEKGMLPDILDRYFEDAGRNEKTPVADIGTVREYDELHFVPDGEHTRAFVKIQDGCNQFCSYCMIPYVRGRVRSRREDEILSEVRKLGERGYREIVLTGIHISSYGLDFDYPGQNRQTPFAKDARTNVRMTELIEKIAEIPEIRRIRLGSLEPGVITEEFVTRISAISKLCPSFHLSMQSGCDETLTRMNRKYTAGDYADKVSLLRKFYDRPSVTTDVIVGFPGETEEEFACTAAFIEDIHFSRMHIFKYSVREGTVAARMKDQIPEKKKQERSKVLFRIDQSARQAYASGFVGGNVSVLFEESVSIDGERYMRGYTREYVPVMMRTDEDLTNKIMTVQAAGISPDGTLAADVME